MTGEAIRPRVTIGIKALNEERHIAAALASSVVAVTPLGGNVILADSGSNDRTLEIARHYPVRIVQIADREQRSCGTGAQLAFQASDSDYFYLLDGDMTIAPGFLEAGIAFLESHPGHAGVGGQVREAHVANAEFAMRARQDALQGSQVIGNVDRLDCGGLYRTSALRGLGYFADRNLHAFEEFELGARLAAEGWHLARIPVDAVTHFGHSEPALKLVLRRLVTGYAGAPGEVLRASLGTKAMGPVLRQFTQLKQGLAAITGWVVAAIALALGLWWLPLLLAAGLVGWLALRFSSLSIGLYLAVVWNVHALGLIQGVLRRRTDPRTPVAFVDVTPGGSSQ